MVDKLSLLELVWRRNQLEKLDNSIRGAGWQLKTSMKTLQSRTGKKSRVCSRGIDWQVWRAFLPVRKSNQRRQFGIQRALYLEKSASTFILRADSGHKEFLGSSEAG